MIALLLAALACVAVRGVFLALASWHDLPRSNDDMVFF